MGDISLKTVSGRFILVSEDQDHLRDENEMPKFNDDGSKVLGEPYPVYFESSAGEGKAKYWTIELNEAMVFGSIDEAVAMMLQLSNQKTIKIRQLIEPSKEQEVDISELVKLASLASPGEWYAYIGQHDTVSIGLGSNSDKIIAWSGFDSNHVSMKQSKHNARFIAMANPETIVRITEELLYLRARIKNTGSE